MNRIDEVDNEAAGRCWLGSNGMGKRLAGLWLLLCALLMTSLMALGQAEQG